MENEKRIKNPKGRTRNRKETPGTTRIKSTIKGRTRTRWAKTNVQLIVCRLQNRLTDQMTDKTPYRQVLTSRTTYKNTKSHTIIKTRRVSGRP